jgi:L-fuconolactonase
MPPTRRIDAHHHIWDLAARAQPWTDDLPPLRRTFGFGELRESLQRNEIEGTIVVHTLASAEETDELLALAASTAEVDGVVGWFDLAAPALADTLDRSIAGPGGDRLVGARHQLQVEPDPDWLRRADVQSGLRTLATRGLSYDIVVSPHQLPLVTEVVQSSPDVRFVLDHAGKPAIAEGDLGEWRRDISALARCANVAVKLSGLVTEASWDGWTVADLRPVADHLLTEFGADRVMFGSDWPVCLLAASYDQVVTAAADLVAGLSSAERDEVWGGTAQRWYAG